jgi:cytochrome c oxidase subunit II
MISTRRKSTARRAVAFLPGLMAMMAGLFTNAAWAEYGLNFKTPVTPLAHIEYDLHMLILWVCVVIFVLVFGVMFYSLYAHRKSKGAVAAKFSHSTTAEIIWTIIPIIILITMAVPSTYALIEMEDTTASDMTVKITGYQWKWRYEFIDHDVDFYSAMSTPRAQIENLEPKGENYLLEVDRHLVLPVGKKIRLLITANDVIHAWWVPELGAKKDAIPGFINEIWTYIDEPGTYRGQCAELCGKDHGFMPIVVDAVSQEDFEAWVKEQNEG